MSGEIGFALGFQQQGGLTSPYASAAEAARSSDRHLALLCGSLAWRFCESAGKEREQAREREIKKTFSLSSLSLGADTLVKKPSQGGVESVLGRGKRQDWERKEQKQ